MGVWLTIFSFRRNKALFAESAWFRRKLKIVSQTPEANRSDLSFQVVMHHLCIRFRRARRPSVGQVARSGDYGTARGRRPGHCARFTTLAYSCVIASSRLKIMLAMIV